MLGRAGVDVADWVAARDALLSDPTAAIRVPLPEPSAPIDNSAMPVSPVSRIVQAVPLAADDPRLA